MTLKKLLNTIGGPVATLLAPVTGGASLAVLAAAKAITGASTEKEAVAQLSQNPGKMAEFKIQMDELAQKELETILEDRQNARSLAIALKDTDQRWTQPILSIIAVGGFFGVTWALMGALTVPAAQRDILFMLLGVLAKVFSDVYAFYFGSSHGSQLKTKQLLK